MGNMTPVRSLALPLLLIAFGVGLAGCTTAAVAIDECREIESARCESSVPCGIIDADEVEGCKRFYDDQCLHGIQGPLVPTSEQQDQCVALIKDAGKKALSAFIAAEAADTEEERNDALKAQVKACVVVAVPWNTEECAFILPEEKAMGGESQDSK